MFQKKPIKILSDPDKLLAYAAWYYGKYAPPLSKLRERLLLKASSESLAEETLARFSNYVDDRTNLESKVSFAARGGKTLYKTRSSLVMKGFDKDEVRSVLESEDSFTDWNVRSSAVRKRLASFASKGKSRSVALMTIKSEYPEFKDLLDQEVRENYPSDSELLASCHGLPESVPADPAQKKKAQDRLVRLGFRYSDLSAFFNPDD
ncbi:MAG: hypothetical protein WA194_07040 [Patescibacteria group bacterium]